MYVRFSGRDKRNSSKAQLGNSSLLEVKLNIPCSGEAKELYCYVGGSSGRESDPGYSSLGKNKCLQTGKAMLATATTVDTEFPC